MHTCFLANDNNHEGNYMKFAIKISKSRKTFTQFVKYLAVGIISNILAYIIYLAITLSGCNPIVSMTAVYTIAGGISFVANKTWTFKSDTCNGSAITKYIGTQLLGYGSNLLLLTILHYTLKIPHYLAQLLGISLVAIELFFLNRYYVFV